MDFFDRQYFGMCGEGNKSQGKIEGRRDEETEGRRDGEAKG